MECAVEGTFFCDFDLPILIPKHLKVWWVANHQEA